MLQRGYSRDHRSDCKQVVLALIVNVDGSPLSYETFDGGRTDVTTLEILVRMVERTYDQARRVWVFDCGMVSEATLAAVRRRSCAIWVTLKYMLQCRGTGLTPSCALAQLATLQSADVTLPTSDGREIRLRRVATPTPERQRLRDHLDLSIPAHFE